MKKKITSLVITLSLATMLLVGCKKNQEEFYMTDNTTAMDNSVEYSAKTYKEAYFSTKNYSSEYLQKELVNIINEIKSEKDKAELIKLLNAYVDGDKKGLDTIKSIFEKYNVIKLQSDNSELENNPMYEISSRLYKATLNATKKNYDINDFYLYYKNELSSASETSDKLENKIKMTAIKEYTIADIYKTAYSDSFINTLVTKLEKEKVTNKNEHDNSDKNVTDKNEQKEEDKVISDNSNKEENKTDKDNSKPDTSDKTDKPSDSEDDKYPEYLELTEVLKSQIYDAGVNCAIDYIGQNSDAKPSVYARSVFDALESDNPLGNNKEEGFKSFLNGFKTTLQNNNIEYN